METEMEIDRLLRRQEVLDRVGLSRSLVYQMMKDNRFPRPLRLGKRAVAWSEAAINEWVANRPLSNGGIA
ncbi:helix-turn-helix transcriptional regulator [Sphingomonas sp. T1]|uniref:helix-turn-helix transcriptional regulator n=1 Tax=Sphingomonas sp. T1 TaxID=2653172 RepID=UPI0019168466